MKSRFAAAAAACLAAGLLALVAGATTQWAARADAPASSAGDFRIVAPASGAHVQGLTLVRAAVADAIAASVARVSFRVDGDALCVREKPPFECEWDAGSADAVHVVRAVAELADGSRRVVSLRTAAAGRSGPRAPGLTIGSDVNVVQVIAIVTDAHGRFVSGLGEPDFHVFEDDLPQPVSHLIG
ncbi:MAG TPA: Ig-like domain-containing protein, partial [Vicinamibacteria bacterium]|nr:Ig-like domain-containing protein [Vicinamibacteria bacterium]